MATIAVSYDWRVVVLNISEFVTRRLLKTRFATDEENVVDVCVSCFDQSTRKLRGSSTSTCSALCSDSCPSASRVVMTTAATATMTSMTSSASRRVGAQPPTAVVIVAWRAREHAWLSHTRTWFVYISVTKTFHCSYVVCFVT